MAAAGTGDLIIDSPDNTNMRARLERGRYSLGRSPSNELAFPEDYKLSREHLVFERTEDGWTVRDVGSRNGTKLNGMPLTRATLLAHGDQIAAGHLSIRFDTRGEFTTAKVNEIRFVEQDFEATGQTVSLDLRSALANSTDLGGCPTLQNEHLGALVRAGRELVSRGSLDDLFQLLLELSVNAAKAARGAVLARHGDGPLQSRAVRGQGVRISTAVRDAVMNERKSLLVRDARLDSIFGLRESIRVQDIRSILAVPLQTDERVIGMLYLDSPYFVREFTPADLNLATVMANIAAIRIEHARLTEEEQARELLDQELERAAEIQRAILPGKAPEIPGCDLAGYNAPCHTVGGDYYDFIEYPDGRVALFIGDVAGKGLPAALLMSSLNACVHVLFENPEPLADQLNRLNRNVARTCPRDCYITFFAAVLDPATGELAYCNAGHNAPRLLRAAGEVEALAATGIPLGILRDASYERKVCRLRRGDMLLLFSDGVTEAAAPGNGGEFGEDRLIVAMRAKRDYPAADLIEAINTEVSLFTGGAPAADDITLVVLQMQTKLEVGGSGA